MTEVEVLDSVLGELVERDPLAEYTENWLFNRRFSPHTREAYRRDVGQWLSWCSEHGLDPLQVRFTDVNSWGRALEGGDEGKPLAATTVARKMSAISSWYAFLVKLGALPANPAAASDRPEVDRDFSATVAFTHEDAAKMLGCAQRGDKWIGPVAHVLATWLVEMGTRASETVAVQVSDLGHDRGFRIVAMRNMKGGRSRIRVIPQPLALLLEEFLQWRVATERVADVSELEGALFVNEYGNSLTRKDVGRFVRRLAKEAGLVNADKITPHSFRHAWNQMARRRGAALEDRQFAMGHRDPRTTRRYDQADQALERDPSLLVAAAVTIGRE
jgi:integrase/recombinase XerD